MDIRIRNLQDLINILENDDYNEILSRFLENRHRLNYSILLNQNQQNNIEPSPDSYIEPTQNYDIDESNIDESNIDESNIDESNIDESNIDESEIQEEVIDISELANNFINNIINNTNTNTNNEHDIQNSRNNQPLSIEGFSKLNTFRVWTSYPGKCCICLEEYRWLDKVVELPCKHNFHHNCIDKWFSNKCTCPVCRFNLNPENTHRDMIRNIVNMTRFITGVVEFGANNLIN